jgi:hypothetical protein
LKTLLLLASAAMMFSAQAQAAGSLIDLETPSYSFLPEKGPEEGSLNLWQRFDRSFQTESEEQFSDAFHPFNMIRQVSAGQVRLFDENIDDTAEMASDALYDTFSRSLRDAALEMNFPVVTWLRDRQDFFAHFLWDSLDSVGEQSLSPLELTYRQTERSWWKEVANSSRVRFGLRPFNTSPYAFMSWRIKRDGQLLCLGHLRYRLRGFTDHSFELGLSLPITSRFSLDFGTCYRIGREDNAKSLVCKLTKYLSQDSVLFVGMEAQQNPVLIAGFSASW